MMKLLKNLFLIIAVFTASTAILMSIVLTLNLIIGVRTNDNLSYSLDIATSLSIVIAVLVFIFTEMNEREKERSMIKHEKEKNRVNLQNQTKLRAIQDIYNSLNKIRVEVFSFQEEIESLRSIRHLYCKKNIEFRLKYDLQDSIKDISSGVEEHNRDEVFEKALHTITEEMKSFWESFRKQEIINLKNETEVHIGDQIKLMSNYLSYYDRDIKGNPVNVWSISKEGIAQLDNINNEFRSSLSKLLNDLKGIAPFYLGLPIPETEVLTMTDLFEMKVHKDESLDGCDFGDSCINQDDGCFELNIEFKEKESNEFTLMCNTATFQKEQIDSYISSFEMFSEKVDDSLKLIFEESVKILDSQDIYAE